jgi:hypothetical protein
MSAKPPFVRIRWIALCALLGIVLARVTPDLVSERIARSLRNTTKDWAPAATASADHTGARPHSPQAGQDGLVSQRGAHPGPHKGTGADPERHGLPAEDADPLANNGVNNGAKGLGKGDAGHEAGAGAEPIKITRSIGISAKTVLRYARSIRGAAHVGDDGKPDGVQVFGVGGSGLQDGDVIESIEGAAIASPDDGVSVILAALGRKQKTVSGIVRRQTKDGPVRIAVSAAVPEMAPNAPPAP